ncbi:hypothetical protein EX30DRAFT_339076 [Ascodesmis nigricans]|uniref:Uncharacterized protein n=1 Tax=Ascodesmis nigricans TaxID=341454 RepID=A0A4S2N1F8_9PEZI|nr:hypothetical protein EX30DRAFT_339076 [Ascodesmis nigricans]
MLSISLPSAAPPLPPSSHHRASSDPDGDITMSASADDLDHLPTTLVTPGEPLTTSPQWMRGHGTYLTPPSTITSSVLGHITKTNKLLSVTPLHSRYTPEIGDLVIGRISEVQAKRWKVDIGSHQHAALLLSSINLPGGILRKRTSTDELQIRTFFSEGDLLVAEVQSLFQDGSASLHTRSLKYGKLRNGMLVVVPSAMVPRSKNHTVVLKGGAGAGEVEVVLGVNGFVWIAKKRVVEVKKPEGGVQGMVSITRLEEEASMALYSNENDEVDEATRKEIARVAGVVRVLAREGVRVEEEVLKIGYKIAVEMAEEGDEGLEGERGRRMVERVLGS